MAAPPSLTTTLGRVADYPSPEVVGTVVAIITATISQDFKTIDFLTDEMSEPERTEALHVFGQITAGALSRIAVEEGRSAPELLQEIAAGLARQFPIE